MAEVQTQTTETAETDQTQETATATATVKDKPGADGNSLDFEPPEPDIPVNKRAKKASTKKSSGASEKTDTAGNTGDDKTSAGTQDDKTQSGAGKVPSLDPELVNRAGQLGFKPDEIEEFGSNKALGRAIELLTAQQRGGKQETTDTGAKKEQAAATANVQAPKLEIKLPQQWDDSDISSTLTDFQKQANEALAAMHTRLNEYGAVADRLKNLEEAEDVRSVAEFTRWATQKFDALNNGSKDLFGNGKEVTATQKGNRDKVFDAMDVIEAGRHAKGLAPLSDDDLFERAINSEFSSNLRQQTRTEIAQELDNRSKTHTARPAQGAHAKSAKQKAIEVAREKLDEFGVTDDLDDMRADLPD